MEECIKEKLELDETSSYLSNALQLAVSTAIRILELSPQNDTQTMDPSAEFEKHPSRSNSTNVLTAKPLREINLDQVSWHDQIDDCWIILYDRVYDITEFLDEHPGGADVLMEYAGRDATLAYRGFGHSAQAWQILQKYLIGVLPEKERTKMFIPCELGINFQLRAASS